MRKILFIAISFLFGTNCLSQKEDSIMIKKISDDILINGKAYDNLRHLTKKIGGRLAGSPQMTIAEQWGEQVMRSSGADRVIMQECKVPHWVRGGEDKAEVTGGKKLDVVALGNSMGSGARGVKAEVLLVNSYDELEKKRDEVKDKIVFYNYKFNPTYIQTFRSYGDASQYRGSGPSRAAKYGAKAVIVRSMSHSTDNNPHTGATRYIDSFAKIPAVAIGLRDADWLSEELQKGKLSVQIKTKLRMEKHSTSTEQMPYANAIRCSTPKMRS